MKQVTSSTKIKAAIGAAFIALCFVLMGVCIRYMQESFTTFQQMYIRLMLASLIALVLLKPKFNGLFSNLTKKDWKIYILRALTYFTVGVGLGTYAVQHANLSTVAFISSLPIAGLVAWVMFREKIPGKSIGFIILSVVGLAFVAGVSLSDFRVSAGEFAAIISTIAFNIGFLMARLHSKKKNNYENSTILLLIAWIPFFVLTIFEGEGLFPNSITTPALIALVISALMNVAIITLINYVFTNLKAYVAANILLLQGFFALIVGFIVYGEKPTFAAMFGGLIIVGCAFAINKIESQNKVN